MDTTQVENILFDVLGDDAGVVFQINPVDGTDSDFDLICDGNELFFAEDIVEALEDSGLNPRNAEWRSPADAGVEVTTEADYINDFYVEITIPI